MAKGPGRRRPTLGVAELEDELAAVREGEADLCALLLLLPASDDASGLGDRSVGEL
jgi:hypothetical protein